MMMMMMMMNWRMSEGVWEGQVGEELDVRCCCVLCVFCKLDKSGNLFVYFSFRLQKRNAQRTKK
jgi:hypothetical protein